MREKETALMLLIASYDNLTGRVWNDIKPLVEERQSKDLPVYVISALPLSYIRPFLAEKDMELPVYTADRALLLTMIRSSPGLMVLKEGVILAKYGFRDVPAPKKWEKLMQEDPELVVTRNNIHVRLRTQLFVVILLILVYLLRKGYKVLFTSTMV